MILIWRYSPDVVNIALKGFTHGGESYWFMQCEAGNVGPWIQQMLEAHNHSPGDILSGQHIYFL